MNGKTRDPLLKLHTFVDVVRYRAGEQQDCRAFTFLNDGETEGASLTFGELEEQARAAGAAIREYAKPGERALLLYPPGLDFIVAFLGCMYAGVIAVPAYPPHLNRPTPRISAIIRDCRPQIALTTGAAFSGMKNQCESSQELKSLRWLMTDTIDPRLGDDLPHCEINGDTIAFLQYTSGSTALPKGVMVSHGNLLHNEAMVREAFRHSRETAYVSWLPLFHDMGLIGNVLQCVYVGAPCYIMAPMAFLQKPYRWLHAVSRYKAHTSGGPNFAYELCTGSITPEQRETLDLSNWNIAFNGSEPVRSKTLECFADTFKSCGFRQSSFYPCYGLAEATLFVTGEIRKDMPPVLAIDEKARMQNRIEIAGACDGKGIRTVVGCGHAWLEQEVVIADPEALTQSPPDTVGEIWISGPSVAKGYWGKAEETERTFGACLKDVQRGPFLRTGDLGFIRDNDLFITGRLKDLIIIRGRNYYPQDIELAVEECHEALRPGCGAAFSVEVDGEERLAVIQEVRREYRNKNLDDVIHAIQGAITESCELQAYAIVLVGPGGVSKTSSGKVKRHACKEDFLQGRLKAIREWREDAAACDTAAPSAPPETPEDVGAWLVSRMAARLGLEGDQIDIREPAVRYGLDSMKAFELTHLVEKDLGVVLPIGAFFEASSISQIITQLKQLLEADNPNTYKTLPAVGDTGAEYPLSWAQKALWFSYRLQPESTLHNIVRAVRMKSEIDIPLLERTFQRLTDRHPALRITFADCNGEPVQRIQKSARISFSAEDASGWDEIFLDQRLRSEGNRPFNLEQGPLMRAAVFALSKNEYILLLAMHHIITDFWSFEILIRELGLFYTEEKDGIQANLPSPGLQFTDYVRRQQQMLDGDEGRALWEYWRDKLAGELPVLNLPTVGHEQALEGFEGSSVRRQLDAATARRLKAFAGDKGLTLYMVLLAAFNLLLYLYTGQEDVVIGSPVAGRSGVKSANVVGIFTNPVALRMDLSRNIKLSAFLAQVRKTVLDAFAHQDYPFALLVERLKPARHPGRSPVFQASFVFQNNRQADTAGLTAFALGEAGVKLQAGGLALESMAFEQQHSQYDIALYAGEVEGGIGLNLVYKNGLYDGRMIEKLLDNFKSVIDILLRDQDTALGDISLTEMEQSNDASLDLSFEFDNDEFL